MVERRPPQQAPGTAGREDTVAIPVSRPESNGSTGNGKVLPPMPSSPPESTKPTAPPKQAAATRPPAAKPAASRTTAPKTPAAGTPVVDAAPAEAPAKPAAKPAAKTAVSPMPVVPEVDKRAERQAEREAKAKERAELKAAKDAETANRKAADSKDAPRSRRARLRMTRIDPWSVMKTAFLLSIALGIVIVVSVFMVWSVLDAADVWSSINQTVRDVTGETATPFDIEDYLGTRRVVGFSMIVAAVDVVLLTAIATLGAFLYNMSASLLGGIEVTLAEDK